MLRFHLPSRYKVDSSNAMGACGIFSDDIACVAVLAFRKEVAAEVTNSMVTFYRESTFKLEKKVCGDSAPLLRPSEVTTNLHISGQARRLTVQARNTPPWEGTPANGAFCHARILNEWGFPY